MTHDLRTHVMQWIRSVNMAMAFLSMAIFFLLASSYEPIAYTALACCFLANHYYLRGQKTYLLYAAYAALAVAAIADLCGSVIAPPALWACMFLLSMSSVKASANSPLKAEYYLAAPLILHLAIAAAAMLPFLLQHGANWEYMSNTGLRSHIQIGSKNFGQAMAVLVALCSHGLFSKSSTHARHGAKLVLICTVVALALADTVLAYISIAVGFAVFLAAWWWLEHKSVTLIHGLLGAAALLAGGLLVWCYATGLVRIATLPETLAAVGDPSSQRAWIYVNAWGELCKTTLTECPVNASLFLRASWILFGMDFIAAHPWGISDVKYPLAAAIRMSFPNMNPDAIIYEDFHSELVRFAVQYGIAALLAATAALAVAVYAAIQYLRPMPGRHRIPLLLFVLCLWGIRWTFDSYGSGGLFLFSAASIGIVFAAARTQTRNAFEGPAS